MSWRANGKCELYVVRSKTPWAVGSPQSPPPSALKYQSGEKAMATRWFVHFVRRCLVRKSERSSTTLLVERMLFAPNLWTSRSWNLVTLARDRLRSLWRLRCVVDQPAFDLTLAVGGQKGAVLVRVKVICPHLLASGSDIRTGTCSSMFSFCWGRLISGETCSPNTRTNCKLEKWIPSASLLLFLC